MYTATYSLKEIGTFKTFKDAFKALYDAVLSDLKLGCVSQMVLAEMTWITGNGEFCPFFEARDRMCHEGFLANGKWQDRDVPVTT